MKNKIYLFIAFALFLILPIISGNLGYFKQNECVNIIVPLNSSGITLTNIITPSPNSSVIVSNKPMTMDGNLFNYTFCNTSILGTYTYGYCANNGDCYGNEFIINGSGQEVTQSQITLIIMGLVVMLIVVAFFFILSMLFKYPGTKMFLMSLSAITLIVLIAIISSNAEVYLAEFPGLVNIYIKYYILVTILAGACMSGIILWLIAYSLKLFNSSRGRIPEDD